MTTAIVVDNYDPTFKNRIRVRVDGLHTEKIDGEYCIIDDDLPWAMPAPNTSSTGGSSIPTIGSKVYIDQKDRFNFYYYGQVEVKADVKRLMHDNAESSDTVKVIAFANEQIDGKKYKLNIQYLPEQGLLIESNGNQIYLKTNDGIDIKSSNGAEISIESDNTINIKSDKTINLDCNSVNLSDNATKGVILSSKLMEKFNNHTHLCPYGVTNTPTLKLDDNDFSNEVFINDTNSKTKSGAI